MAFNIIIAHIPGEANYAADFLSRMQIDPSDSLSMKLPDKIPVREIQIDTTAEVPDASLSLVDSEKDAFTKTDNTIDETLKVQLQKLGLYKTCLGELNVQEDTDMIVPQGFVRVTRPPISEVEYPDPELLSRSEFKSWNAETENRTRKDTDFEDVKNWIRNEQIPNLAYENSRKKNYAMRLIWLEIEDEVLYSKLYDDTGQAKHKQYCRVFSEQYKELFDVLATQKSSRKLSNSTTSNKIVIAVFTRRRNASRYRWTSEVISVQVRSHWNWCFLEIPVCSTIDQF